MDSEYIFLPKLKQILGFLQKGPVSLPGRQGTGPFFMGLENRKKAPALTQI
ncbi:MAG: hypothetical protein V8Q30_08950 [Acutalibacteraceae bacterium]